MLAATTTPIADVLHWAMLDGLITLGALIGSIVQIVVVLRTLYSVTVGRREQARIVEMQQTAYDRQAIILRYLGLEEEAATVEPQAPGGGMTDQPAEQYAAEPEAEPEHPDITPDQYEDTERDPNEPDDTEPEEAGKNDGPTEGLAP